MEKYAVVRFEILLASTELASTNKEPIWYWRSVRGRKYLGTMNETVSRKDPHHVFRGTKKSNTRPSVAAAKRKRKEIHSD
eukprot:scaffold68080_cov51-Attheya_sp.AAC.3